MGSFAPKPVLERISFGRRPPFAVDLWRRLGGDATSSKDRRADHELAPIVELA
jgi:hypothetical protein